MPRPRPPELPRSSSKSALGPPGVQRISVLLSAGSVSKDETSPPARFHALGCDYSTAPAARSCRSSGSDRRRLDPRARAGGEEGEDEHGHPRTSTDGHRRSLESGAVRVCPCLSVSVLSVLFLAARLGGRGAGGGRAAGGRQLDLEAAGEAGEDAAPGAGDRSIAVQGDGHGVDARGEPVEMEAPLRVRGLILVRLASGGEQRDRGPWQRLPLGVLDLALDGSSRRVGGAGEEGQQNEEKNAASKAHRFSFQPILVLSPAYVTTRG